MIISAIVAVDKNNVIGKDNEIPWYLPADLKYFKKTTLNHHIIMGRKTFQSIGRPLPKRTNIVLTRDLFFTASGVIIAHSIDESLNMALQNGEEEVFIIGGGELYLASQSYWDRVYLTEVDTQIDQKGAVFFPRMDPDQWDLVYRQRQSKEEKTPYDYVFNLFELKSF